MLRQALGYVLCIDDPRRDRLFFVKGPPPLGSGRSHPVHARVPADTQRQCAFRDRLRAQPDDAARYAAPKRQLATAHADDREAYIEGKTVFIRTTLGNP